MLFNSYIFLFAFLPLVLLGWWTLRHTWLRLVFLTLASYIFYAWWDWRFVPLMIASTTVDYLAGDRIARSDSPAYRRGWLVCSLTFNLVILGFFKYYDFFANSVNGIAASAGFTHLAPVLNIVLPIGISFYTFNSMSYTIDIYRGRVRPAKSALHFSAFVAMFPHLVAGPIVRYSDIELQFAELKKKLSSQQAALGIYFFVLGLGKKMLLADRLAHPVSAFFATPGQYGILGTWLGVLGYTFQLYFDFSGYSDMAVGLAHLLGIQFPQNFDSPYKAVDIADFWRRWHMSLSTWLRDYLFIPLGGSRGSRTRTAVNLSITMFLGGLWHGANWTFVVWGLYHGLLLVIHALAKQRGWTPSSQTLGRFVTFLSVLIGWVFFRAETLAKAGKILSSLGGATVLTQGFGPLIFTPAYLVALGIAAAAAFFAPNSWELAARFQPRLRYSLMLAAIFVGSVLLLDNGGPFLYFQF